MRFGDQDNSAISQAQEDELETLVLSGNLGKARDAIRKRLIALGIILPDPNNEDETAILVNSASYGFPQQLRRVYRSIGVVGYPQDQPLLATAIAPYLELIKGLEIAERLWPIREKQPKLQKANNFEEIFQAFKIWKRQGRLNIGLVLRFYHNYYAGLKPEYKNQLNAWVEDEQTGFATNDKRELQKIVSEYIWWITDEGADFSTAPNFEETFLSFKTLEYPLTTEHVENCYRAQYSSYDRSQKMQLKEWVETKLIVGDSSAAAQQRATFANIARSVKPEIIRSEENMPKLDTSSFIKGIKSLGVIIMFGFISLIPGLNEWYIGRQRPDKADIYDSQRDRRNAVVKKNKNEAVKPTATQFLSAVTVGEQKEQGSLAILRGLNPKVPDTKLIHSEQKRPGNPQRSQILTSAEVLQFIRTAAPQINSFVDPISHHRFKQAVIQKILETFVQILQQDGMGGIGKARDLVRASNISLAVATDIDLYVLDKIIIHDHLDNLAKLSISALEKIRQARVFVQFISKVLNKNFTAEDERGFLQSFVQHCYQEGVTAIANNHQLTFAQKNIERSTLKMAVKDILGENFVATAPRDYVVINSWTGETRLPKPDVRVPIARIRRAPVPQGEKNPFAEILAGYKRQIDASDIIGIESILIQAREVINNKIRALHDADENDVQIAMGHQALHELEEYADYYLEASELTGIKSLVDPDYQPDYQTEAQAAPNPKTLMEGYLTAWGTVAEEKMLNKYDRIITVLKAKEDWKNLTHFKSIVESLTKIQLCFQLMAIVTVKSELDALYWKTEAYSQKCLLLLDAMDLSINAQLFHDNTITTLKGIWQDNNKRIQSGTTAQTLKQIAYYYGGLITLSGNKGDMNHWSELGMQAIKQYGKDHHMRVGDTRLINAYGQLDKAYKQRRAESGVNFEPPRMRFS